MSSSKKRSNTGVNSQLTEQPNTTKESQVINGIKLSSMSFYN